MFLICFHTANERNILMEQAYPKIKSYCQDKGYEFQVVDMRWGVRDEATDDHMTTELCLRELKKCKEVSTGPYFVSLLSHKYGYRPLPREIDADEFEKIMSVTDTEEKRLLLLKWYLRDDNNVPPVYSLNSISKIFPDFVSNDRDKLTETEVVKGVQENPDTENTCLWFKRTIQDIEKQEPSKQLSRYIECLGSEADVKNARDHLHELRDNRLPRFIPQNRIWAYSVQWTNQGINQNVDEHRNYLTRLAGDFVTELCRMVDDGIRRRAASQINDPLYEECLQHMTFCKEKCKDFQGREKTLQQIKEYVLGPIDQPFVIHGSSGCGKTSIMAMAAQKTWEWLEGKVGIVLRFVGTTPNSSDIMAFLPSITKQIRLLNRKTSINSFYKDKEQAFLQALKLTSTDLPIVVIIDSLDQFNPNNSARKLSWLPAKLPKNVKIIVSTLEEAKYECFPKLKAKIKPENFLNVPKLPNNEVSIIINHWLKRRNRTLTSQQLQCLMDAFDKCPLPLFLKLSFDEACRWTSRDTIDADALQTTIHDSIHTLFARLEKIHGKLFVSRALGYMTLVKGGVSEAELEDIMACDDEVLNDVYQYWTPPTRRLPPLLLVRLKSDLQQYLVERGIDGLRVIFWYHRQFIRAATERYCSDKELNILLHKGLADFFSGTWSSGVESEADRYVAAQPLRFGRRTNVRKLMRLPYHLTCSLQLKRLKDECLCNFTFLLLKLTETAVR
ncbi:hypothetical protein KUTeg_018018 [Tegillarca granosa]|uniref:NACHT and WD repeat domain-containing protein 2 n=1 Tax=Tegillarca granosa TaxID=220873 RepID=A0ABQ9ELK2_TEGGR|nr:hypothetical protein KUTeg_018018 [Tegillarca granosa]